MPYFLSGVCCFFSRVCSFFSGVCWFFPRVCWVFPGVCWFFPASASFFPGMLVFFQSVPVSQSVVFSSWSAMVFISPAKSTVNSQPAKCSVHGLTNPTGFSANDTGILIATDMYNHPERHDWGTSIPRSATTDQKWIQWEKRRCVDMHVPRQAICKLADYDSGPLEGD